MAHFALHPDPLLPKCARSVTTLDGESDVLVVYLNALNERVAILIEDKIGAGFQPDQAARYRHRGKHGIEQDRWDHFWTCLVAPARYAKTNKGFDTRVNMEDLATFFDRFAGDARAQFKAKMLLESAAKTSIPGVKNPDAAMTEYRRQYSELAARMLQDGGWQPEFKAECFSQDTWFQYFHPSLGKKLKCIHKPLKGAVELIFPAGARETLKGLLGNDEQSELRVTAIGKTSVGIEARVQKLAGTSSFKTTEMVNPIVVEATAALAKLNEFMLQNKDALMPYGFLPDQPGPRREEDAVRLRMLEAQLFGLMWSWAIGFGSPAGFEFPDLAALSQDASGKMFIRIPGMAGGFTIVVRHLQDGTPIAFTESGSRISDGFMFHEIEVGAIYGEEDDLYEGPPFEVWVDQRMQQKKGLR